MSSRDIIMYSGGGGILISKFLVETWFLPSGDVFNLTNAYQFSPLLVFESMLQRFLPNLSDSGLKLYFGSTNQLYSP